MHSRRYSAFLSYRYADTINEGRRWAEWLHRALERYVVPADLIGTPNLRNEPVRHTLYPIFRDEDELPVDGHQATGIRTALKASDFLVVLCSPRTAVSPAVRNEVRQYKELVNCDRIVAVIVAGEPNASSPDKAGRGVLPSEECFCEELRFGVRRENGLVDWSARAEVITADVRIDGSREEGFVTAEAYREFLTVNSTLSQEKIAEHTEQYQQKLEKALLDIVAGLLSVPVEQLAEREPEHRAKVAEKEAVRQREIAEREHLGAERERAVSEASRHALVENDRLKTRNRVLMALMFLTLCLVGAAGWHLWQMMNREKSVLAERDKAINAHKAADGLIKHLQFDLRRVPEVVGNQSVLQSINDRILQYEMEYSTDVGDLKVDHERAMTLLQNGNVLMSQNKLEDALTAYREYHVVMLGLAEAKPDNRNWKKDLAWSYLKMGEVQQEQKQLDDSLANYQKALLLFEQLASGSPAQVGFQTDLALCHDRVADILSLQNKLLESTKSYQSGLLIRDKLVKSAAGNLEFLTQLSVSYEKLGHVFRLRKQPEIALENYVRCMEIRKQVYQAKPDDVGSQHELAVACENVGIMSVQRRMWNEAGTAFIQEIELARPWLSRPDADHKWMGLFAFGAGNYWLVLRQLDGSISEAERGRGVANLQTAEQALMQLRDKNLLSPHLKNYLGWIQRMLADVEPPGTFQSSN